MLLTIFLVLVGLVIMVHMWRASLIVLSWLAVLLLAGLVIVGDVLEVAVVGLPNNASFAWSKSEFCQNEPHMPSCAMAREGR